MGKPGCFGSALIFLLLCYFVYQADLNGQIPAALDPRTVAIAKPGQSPQPVMQVQAQATPTITQTPTLSVDYQKLYDQQVQTSESSDLTLAAANVAIAVITAQHDSNQSAEKIAEDQRLAAEAAALQRSIDATATVYPTSVYLTEVSQLITKEAAKTEIAGTQQATALMESYAEALENKTNAEVYAASGEETERSMIFLRYASGFVFLVMAIFIFIRAIAILLRRGDGPTQTAAKPKGIPFEPDEKSDGDRLVRIYPDIPAPLPEFLQFCDGIVDNNLTLVFRDWIGSPVHKYLKDLRMFLKVNQMTYPIPGGELLINEKGMDLLRDSCANNSPPPPYRCAL